MFDMAKTQSSRGVPMFKIHERRFLLAKGSRFRVMPLIVCTALPVVTESALAKKDPSRVGRPLRLCLVGSCVRA